jgi:hypothetical protein
MCDVGAGLDPRKFRVKSFALPLVPLDVKGLFFEAIPALAKASWTPDTEPPKYSDISFRVASGRFLHSFPTRWNGILKRPLVRLVFQGLLFRLAVFSIAS